MAEMEVGKDVVQNDMGDIQAQLEDSISKLSSPEDGQLVDGVIVQVTNEYVFVDVGCKSEGRLPLSDFNGEQPKAGDIVTVLLEKQFGKYGPEISKKSADKKRFWKDIAQAQKDKTAVSGTIEKTVKGGFEVDLGGGIHAFLPVSQADTVRVERPEALVGLKTKFYVERLYTDKKQNVVVNRRKYMEEETSKAREKFFNEIQIGDTVKGTVKSFTSFGAFVDLGGFDGLLHINDMSWGHVVRPKDFVKKGQEVELKVIRIAPEEKRINLSLKHFTEDPWMHFEDRYHVNDVVKGKVTKLTDFGAFIELEEGIEGLVHISEFSWTKKIEKPADIVKPGDEIECMILGYDIQAGRVSLGVKQVMPNPWDTIAEKYPVGTKIKGKVVKLTGAGAFVEMEEGIDGFLHADDISWTKKVKHPGSELKVDDEIEAVVIANEPENHRVKIGIKQLTDNPWKKFAEAYKVGDTLEGEITSITDFGVFVKSPVAEIEGLVNKANLSDDRNVPFEEAVKKYNVGDKINVYVADVNVDKEKVAFSVREFKRKQQRDEISQYMAKADNDSDGAYTFADALKSSKKD